MKKLLKIFYLLILFFPVSAQELITEDNVPDSILTNEQLRRKTIYESDLIASDIILVRIANVLNRQVQNLVKLKIPGRQDSFYFQGQYIEIVDSIAFNWIGELVINDNGVAKVDTNHDGRLILCYRNDRVFGEVLFDTTYYQIRDLTDGLNALVLTNDTLAMGSCSMYSGDEGQEMNGTNPNRNADNCPVSVLVMFTDSAFADAPDIVDIAELSILISNNILRNSAIPQQILMFRLEAILPLHTSDFQETEDIEFDRRLVPGVARILDVRDSTNADIVIILTKEIYPPTSGAVSAFGAENGSKKDSAFAIVEQNFATGRTLAFSHELFHLFNARHETKDVCPSIGTDLGNPDAHGFIINREKKNRRRWTIMAVCLQDQAPAQVVKVQHLSNPNVEYKTCTTGDSETANNARQVKDIRCAISSYYEDLFPFVSITADDYACSEEYLFLEGNISDNVPTPHEYTWRYSTDGSNWSNPITNSDPNFDIEITFPVNSVIFVELEAGAENGPKIRAYKSILVVDDPHLCSRGILLKNQDENPITIYSITPNPSSSFLNINYSGDLGNVGFTLVNVIGHPLINVNDCSNNSQIDISSIAVGTYFAYLSDEVGKLIFVEKIIVLR